jgi:anti-sigma factor RsiW
MERSSADRPTDADLVAHIDGELAADASAWVDRWLSRDREIEARRRLLADGGRRFLDAFEPLLAAAPKERLEAMLEELPGYRTPASVIEMRALPRKKPFARAWPGLGLAAAGLLLFLGGAVFQRELPALREMTGMGAAEQAEDDWRQAAAEYVSLYTPETLAGIPDDMAPRERELATVGGKLGIGLRVTSVALPGLSLKRAQLLQYDGKPLGQIAYLDPKEGAVALCIYAGGQLDVSPASEQRAGLNIVHWSSRGRAFMLVGHLPAPRLQELASLLSRQLTL